jgi:hypothetical protein
VKAGRERVNKKIKGHTHDPSASVLIPTCTETLGPANSSRIFTKSMKKKVRAIARAEEWPRGDSKTRGGRHGRGRRNDQTVCTIYSLAVPNSLEMERGGNFLPSSSHS